jgi:hypothetical protein
MFSLFNSFNFFLKKNMTLCLRFFLHGFNFRSKCNKKNKFHHSVLVLVPIEKKKKKGVNSSLNHKHLNLNPWIYNL